MSVLDSLPDRALTDAELTDLNRSDALDVAVDVTEPEAKSHGDVRGLLLATEDWVKGLAYGDVDETRSVSAANQNAKGSGDDGWQVAATRELDDADERFEAMQDCEEAIQDVLEAAGDVDAGTDDE